MSTHNSLVGRSGFAQAIAEKTPLIARLAQETIASRNWSKFGHKAIEIVAEWEAALWEERGQQPPETPKKNPKGGSNDADWAERLIRKKKGIDGVQKPSKNEGREKNGSKWAHVRHGGGYGSPLKKPGQGHFEDEDDEEELPAGRVKEEVVVKIEDGDDALMGEGETL